MSFPEVSAPEQMIFDLRDETEMNLAAKGQQKSTLNYSLGMHRTHPYLVACEQTKRQNWATSVHHLKKQQMILQIGGDTKDEEKIAFSFFNAEEPNDLDQCVIVPK